MKCPLVFSSNLTGMGEQRFVFGDCLQAECAWWLPKDGRCAVLSLALDLSYIESNVQRIGDHDNR